MLNTFWRAVSTLRQRRLRKSRGGAEDVDDAFDCVVDELRVRYSNCEGGCGRMLECAVDAPALCAQCRLARCESTTIKPRV